MNTDTQLSSEFTRSPLTLLVGIIVAVLLIPIWTSLLYAHPTVSLHAHLSVYLLWSGALLATVGSIGFFFPQHQYAFGTTRFLQLGATILACGALCFLTGAFISEMPSEQMRDPSLVLIFLTLISLSYASLENSIWFLPDDDEV